jgi:hypothetical protein
VWILQSVESEIYGGLLFRIEIEPGACRVKRYFSRKIARDGKSGRADLRFRTFAGAIGVWPGANFGELVDWRTR